MAVATGSDARLRSGAVSRGTPWLSAALTVTLGLILLIVDALTPTRFKSATDVNGRPPMIFLAVAGPTPGKASSCSWEAVFKSMGPTLVGAVLSLRDLLLRSGSARIRRSRCPIAPAVRTKPQPTRRKLQ